MRTITITKVAIVSGCLFVGSYGCRQVMGWEEATYWGDGGSAGAGGLSESSSSSGGGKAGAAGAGGMGGVAGNGGMAGLGGMGGMGGGDAGMPECTVVNDCPTVPNSMRTCTNGVCGFTCNTGFGDCTVAAGCETVLATDKNHCGACGKTCAAYCKAGTCNDPVSIAGGYHHHCAVMTNGDVYCWGRNEKGELGDGTLASKPKPSKVKLTSPAVQVDGGASASAMNYTPKTCAAMVNGELWCWGEGNATPAKVIGLSNVKQVSVGDAHTCAVTTTGVLYCWGSNTYGQIGDGGTGYAFSPLQIATSILYVSAGSRHTCSVKINGSLDCWGDNGSGQLGIGSKFDQYSPTAVGSISGVSLVRCGADFTCGLANATTYCWGANQVGQLGTGGVAEQLLPKMINIQAPSKLDVSFNFSGAIVNGMLEMWGYNGAGQLGNGSIIGSYSPVAINLSTVADFALAVTSSCARLSSGVIRCWGSNVYGQLGDGGNQQQNSPVAVTWP